MHVTYVLEWIISKVYMLSSSKGGASRSPSPLPEVLPTLWDPGSLILHTQTSVWEDTSPKVFQRMPHKGIDLRKEKRRKAKR